MSHSGADVGSLLNRFVETLGSETRLLQQLVALRIRPENSGARDEMAQLFAAVDASLTRLEGAVNSLSPLRDDDAATDHAHARTSAHAQRTAARVAAIQEHLPPDLAQALRVQEALNTEPEPETPTGENVPPQQHSNQNRLPRGEQVKMTQAPSLAPAQSKKKPSAQQQQAKKPKSARVWVEEPVVSANSVVPNIQSVDADDLDAAPQYVKGRLTVERIDAVVATLNKVVQAKYTLLRKPLRSLSSQEATRWHEMTSAEGDCPEVEGRSFFTDADIRAECIAMDSTLKTAINILRHVSILKELRGKNRVRVFVIM
jgi:Spindle and kinetochore-associated protein 1